MNQRCYFHKNQPIQHFCSLKQCTLPLCYQCLDIHQQEHEDKRTPPSIIPYNQAYQQVFNTLTQFLCKAQTTKENYLQKLNNDKKQSLKLIEQYYAQYEKKLTQQSSYLLQTQQKLNKLQKGSIKTVIYFYSGDISLKQPQYPHFQQISSQVQKCIQSIKNPQKQEMQTFRHHQANTPQINLQTNTIKLNQQVTMNYMKQQLHINSQFIQKQQEQKNYGFQTKQRANSKKKLIFSNEKYHQQSLHKNTNQPYLQNYQKQENQTYKIFQRENTHMQTQKSQVKNYFNNENFINKQDSVTKKQLEPHPTFFMQESSNINQVLKEAPVISNIDYRQNRSKTLDKFPSMANFKISKENLYNPLSKDQNQKKNQTINVDFKPKKWNKEKVNVQIIPNHHEKQLNSNYSQFMVTEPIAQNEANKLFLQQEFPNRQPLKTSDLDTYPIPVNNIVPPLIQNRERTFSYEPGLRTTMSHNNLQLGKKFEPILGDQLKKNVLSPQEIRKMLEKKIEERNKVLVQKKQYQLKINTDRINTNSNTALNLRKDSMSRIGQTNQHLKKQRQSFNYNQQINIKQPQFQQRSGLYNTRDSIINQIYRQTKY